MTVGHSVRFVFVPFEAFDSCLKSLNQRGAIPLVSMGSDGHEQSSLRHLESCSHECIHTFIFDISLHHTLSGIGMVIIVLRTRRHIYISDDHGHPTQILNIGTLI